MPCECPHCRAANPVGTLFCVACAMPLPVGVPQPVAVGAPAPSPAPAPFAVPVPPAGRRTLVWHEVENLAPTGRVLPLPDSDYRGPVYVGRNDLANGVVVDVDLTTLGGHTRRVSRKHAVLHYDGATVRLADWDSAHGTWLNKRKLVPGQQEPLTDGDEVRLADFVFRVALRP